MAAAATRPSLTLDVPLETSLRIATEVERAGGVCEDEAGRPSRIVFYGDPTMRPETESPRVPDGFRARVVQTLEGLGLTDTAGLRIGMVRTD